MKENFHEAIQKDFELIENALIDIGFQFEDDGVLSFGEDEHILYLQPEILNYGVGGKGVPVETKEEIWISCLIEADSVEKAATVFKDMVKKMKYKPFKDEDAFMGMFAKKGKDQLACYFNPDYPQGYWQNHVLE
jgi:pentatricopeptide repeat protein